MYTRDMSTRDIREHLAEISGVDVSAELVSRATDAVVDELRAWQSRPLERVYLVVYLDVLVLKIIVMHREWAGVEAVRDSWRHFAEQVAPKVA